MSSDRDSLLYENLEANIPIDHCQVRKLNFDSDTIVFSANISQSHWVAMSVTVERRVLLATLFNTLDKIRNRSSIIQGLQRIIDTIIAFIP